MKFQATKIVFLCSVLMLIPFSAQAATEGPGCGKTELFEKLAQSTDVLVTDGAHEIDSSLLFHHFRRALEPGDQVTFELFRNGESLFSEEIFLIRNDPSLSTSDAEISRGDTVIELLSTHAPHRLKLRDLATSGAEAEAKLSVNGELIAAMSPSELVKASEALAQGEAEPHAIASHLRDPGLAKIALPEPVFKGGCEDNCDAQQDFCWDNCVFSGGQPSCFDACDDAYDDCMLACSGGCHPSTQTSTVVSLVSATPLASQQCKYDSFLQRKGQFQQYRLRYKITKTTTTRAADCTITTTTTVSYTYVYCWSYLYSDPYCFVIYGGSFC